MADCTEKRTKRQGDCGHLARIFHKGRREMDKSAEDATICTEDCLQAHCRDVENNFQENCRRFGAFIHCSRPLVKYTDWLYPELSDLGLLYLTNKSPLPLTGQLPAVRVSITIKLL